MIVNNFGIYGIGGNGNSRPTYLPGGNWGLNLGGGARNHLPSLCDGFVFLEVQADLTSVGGTNPQTVYVPCYWQVPP